MPHEKIPEIRRLLLTLSPPVHSITSDADGPLYEALGECRIIHQEMVRAAAHARADETSSVPVDLVESWARALDRRIDLLGNQVAVASQDRSPHALFQRGGGCDR